LKSFPNLGTAATIVKLASYGEETVEHRELLVGLGFGRIVNEQFELTESGHSFDDAVNAYSNVSEAMTLLRDAYLALPVVQALTQALHGRGAVSVDGALHVVARLKLFDPKNSSNFGSLLWTLNELRVVAYSKKFKTVTLLVSVNEEEIAVPAPSVLIVEPDRPFSNRKHLREVLSECEGYIWWAEPHFDKAGLDAIVEIAEVKKITEIRILTGSMPSPADLKNAYAPFISEMKTLGIVAEVRHVAKPDLQLHDRFIIGKNVVWNVPPSGVVTGKGGYSYFTRVEERPPFEEWWSKGSSISGS
jgi:hypothetical protein